jgi:Na+-transporting NADH:ubiquinone oxidoreductase subunit C
MPFDKDSRVFMVVFLVVASVLVAAALTALYAYTKPIMEEQRARLFNRRVLEVFDLAAPGEELPPERIDEIFSRHVEKEEVGGMTVYRGYDDAGEELGLAFEASGSGLWSEIRVLVALTPDYSSIYRLRVVEQGETPGLGGRITEPEFLKKFDDLPLGPAPGYVGVVAYETPDQPYEVAAITGATQTSEYLERLLNEGIASFFAVAGARRSRQED